MTNPILDALVEKGVIKDYRYVEMDEAGDIGEISDMKNSEHLVLYFNSGDALGLTTICSGSLENTSLIISN